MWNALKSKEAIVGLGALVWGIASVTVQLLLVPEGVQMMWLSPLGVFTIAMFILGTFLIFWGIFKHGLSYADKQAIVQQRQENLPLLRNSIDAVLRRQKELALRIGRQPLQAFFEEYLKSNREYKVYRKLLDEYHTSDNVTKHKVATLLAIGKFFFVKSICLNNACRDDKDMEALLAEKDTYYHRNNDKVLSKSIDRLLFAAAKYHSALAYGELATNNQLAYTSATKYARFEEKPEILKGFMVGNYKNMNDRMNLLTRGEDL